MPESDTIAPMLMFGGRAEEAIGFYTALFSDSSVESIERYGPGYPGPEGQVVHQHRKGYKLRERLLRPASVVVAKQPVG